MAQFCGRIILPLELQDLYTLSEVEEQVYQAWRDSGYYDCFTVNVDGCYIMFQFDLKKSGIISWGKKSGLECRTMVGSILELNFLRRFFWFEKLRLLEKEMGVVQVG